MLSPVTFFLAEKRHPRLKLFDKSCSWLLISLFSCCGRDLVIILMSNLFLSSRTFGNILLIGFRFLLDTLGNIIASNNILFIL